MGVEIQMQGASCLVSVAESSLGSDWVTGQQPTPWACCDRRGAARRKNEPKENGDIVAKEGL